MMSACPLDLTTQCYQRSFLYLQPPAKLLRVEEPLRRCWSKKKYSDGPGPKGKSVPEGLEEEYSFLDFDDRHWLKWIQL